MGRRRKPIYIESRIDSTIDEIWEKTQDPCLHEQWDIRFTEISYQPKDEGRPQLFTYATTIAPRVRIEGRGESLGERNKPDGSHWSGLKFSCDDRRSIITKGTGYWRYIPTDDGVRFLTRFDYQPRWGAVGRVCDRYFFRPIFGWATAWSFDRLRIWIETGISPQQSRRQAITHAICASTLSFVWLYHGIIPKILSRASEHAIIEESGFTHSQAGYLLVAFSLTEIFMAFAIAVWSRRRWPYLLSLYLFLALGVGAIVSIPELATEPFSPVTLNFALMSLCAVALLTDRDLPSGRRPLRAAPDTQPAVEDLE